MSQEDKAMPSYCYGDPSNVTDKLRDIERKMQGCGKCCHGFRLWDRFICTKRYAPDENGYCGKFRGKS